MSGKDPLGRQPEPITGDLVESFSDPVREARVQRADQAFKAIWVDYPPQLEVKTRIRRHMEKWDGVRGTPIKGLRLSQDWHSGKSSTVERLKFELAQEQVEGGLESNPFEITHITVEEYMTLKILYQEILRQLGDDFFDEEAKKGPDQDRRTMKLLEDKIARWVRRLGVRLLVADEVQRLAEGGTPTKAVIERFQTFLDRGIVPLLLMGNAKSKAFFEVNDDLAIRCGRPLKLEPMRTRTNRIEAGIFQDFCRSFDEQLVSNNIFSTRSGLSRPNLLGPIITVTGGHIGRVARLIEETYPVALRRGAASIEAFDLSIVTREFAIVNGWVKTDPFSSTS